MGPFLHRHIQFLLGKGVDLGHPARTVTSITHTVDCKSLDSGTLVGIFWGRVELGTLGDLRGVILHNSDLQKTLVHQFTCCLVCNFLHQQ